MLIDPFLEGKNVLKIIENHNHQAFFVGGCVRDLLLKHPIGDIDITTSALPEEIKKIFVNVIPVGIEHGTVIVRYENISYEVTTFRLDGNYTDQRHPDSVLFIDKIESDLQRRDFTINALAMDRDGAIIDLFGGKKDLQQKVIRTVGNGEERFTEDPLRIIRALRFSSQLGFTIETDTLVYMKKLNNQIESIAIERITNEFSKLFSGNYVNNGIDYLKHTQIYKYLPIIRDHPHIIHKLPGSLEAFESFGEVLALFHYMEQSISVPDWIKAWKCSNKMKQETMQLVKAIKYYEKNGLDRLLVYQLSSAYYKGFVKLIHTILHNQQLTIADMREIERDLPIQSKRDLAIGGDDLLALFPNAKAGQWIHQTICKMENKVVLNVLKNTKFELKEWIKCNPPEIN